MPTVDITEPAPLAVARATMRHTQTGFSLVEALAALIVISIGMIGIAALYGHGLNASRTALYRTQAVTLVADMAERIRANRTATTAYERAGTSGSCDLGGNTHCTGAAMAAHDVWAWSLQVGAQLPAGTGTVGVEGTTPPTYTISVSWAEVGFAAPAAYTVTVEIPDV